MTTLKTIFSKRCLIIRSLRFYISTALLLMVVAMFVQCERVGSHPPKHAGDAHAETADASDFNEQGTADLGYVEPGSSHELRYVLHAPPGKTLSNITIDSDCPCVHAAEPQAGPAGGEVVTVQIRFKAPDKVLHYKQDFSVVAEVSGQRIEQPLLIDARLGLPLRVSPSTAYCSPGSTTGSKIELSNEGPETINLIYAISDDPRVKMILPNQPLHSGERIKLEITADDQWEAAHPAHVRIKTTSDNQPEVVVQVNPAPPNSTGTK